MKIVITIVAIRAKGGAYSLSMLKPPSSLTPYTKLSLHITPTHKANIFALRELDSLYLRHCEYCMSTLPSTPVYYIITNLCSLYTTPNLR